MAHPQADAHAILDGGPHNLRRRVAEDDGGHDIGHRRAGPMLKRDRGVDDEERRGADPGMAEDGSG